MDRVAALVGEDLNFDVTGMRQVFLDQHSLVAKGAGCLPFCAGHDRDELCGAVDDAHPAPAAAGGGLDQHGKPDALGFVDQTGGSLVFAVITRDDRHPAPQHQIL